MVSEERVKDAEEEIKQLQIGQTEVKKDLEYLRLSMEEQKEMDESMIKKLDSHSKTLAILVSSRSISRRVLEVVLGGVVTGVLALVAWFTKEALA